MTTPKVKPNALPVSFDQFRKNPVAAVAFCMLLAVSYLYVDLRSGYKEQIEKSNQKIDALDLKIDRLSYALKKSDSALAAKVANGSATPTELAEMAQTVHFHSVLQQSAPTTFASMFLSSDQYNLDI